MNKDRSLLSLGTSAIRGWVFLFCLLLQLAANVRADDTWVFAVQLAATVQSDPPQITLTWPQDPYGALSYTVYRKARDDQDWGTGIVLDGSQTSFTDPTVVGGTAYEYQVVKEGALGYAGYGYIYSGIQAPLIEDRGKLLLIVADNVVSPLANELAQFQSDLTGDGWQVIRHTVSPIDSPDYVRSIIADDYYPEPNAQAVLLFGHIPVLQCGYLNYDGHQYRPMPADTFYGDVDGDWSGSPDFIPSDVELMVGRVDFFDMPGNGSAQPWPSEVELLRNYLNKDHNWRFGLIDVQQRALMDDRRGVDAGWAPAASGYRNFDPLLGHDSIDYADWSNDAPPGQRWMSILENQSYVWDYACGGGEPTGLTYAGTSGDYFEAWSTDVVDGDAKAVFVMLFGSWFGNWDRTDNFMRSFLATPTLGLTACMSGEPHWFLHHMALGEPIGFSTRLTMNNSTTYRSETNDFTRANYIALMGDPTLRMYPVKPPSALNASTDNGVTLSWWPSSDDVIGYHVYRASSPDGPFTRLTPAPISETQFTDTTVSTGEYVYMIRAIKLQTTASGTFMNPSQGIFATVSATISPNAPILLSATGDGSSMTLSWNTQPGQIYHVEAAEDLTQPSWTDISGGILATDQSTSWTDWYPAPKQRFYRIAKD